MQWTVLLPTLMDESYNCADGLIKLVASDELDWKPASGKNWMTAGQLLRHLVDACGFCCRGFDTGNWSAGADADADPAAMPTGAQHMPTITSVEEAQQLLAKDRAIALSVVTNAGEERLSTEMSAAPWEPDHPRSLGLHCLNMVQHLDSHRHQLFYYLKLMGKDVNTMNLWGM